MGRRNAVFGGWGYLASASDVLMASGSRRETPRTRPFHKTAWRRRRWRGAERLESPRSTQHSASVAAHPSGDPTRAPSVGARRRPPTGQSPSRPEISFCRARRFSQVSSSGTLLSNAETSCSAVRCSGALTGALIGPREPSSPSVCEVADCPQVARRVPPRIA